jgi:AbrB family looped-hinge helix DNA binding protein
VVFRSVGRAVRGYVVLDVVSECWSLLYSPSMIGRIGAKGQVVIPKALRDRARLQPGDEVDFELRDEELVLVARRSPLQLGGRFAKTGMAARLLEDRAREPR